jgi:hypothetical protein
MRNPREPVWNHGREVPSAKSKDAAPLKLRHNAVRRLGAQTGTL